jgi:D-alanyl-D-alanine carboxypeptidase
MRMSRRPDERLLAIVGILSVLHLPAHATSREDDMPTALQAAIDRVLEQDPRIPGVALTVHSPRLAVEWSGAAGRRGRGAGEPLRADTPFRIASITKVFTAAAIFRLIEQERIGLYDAMDAHAAPPTLGLLRSGGYAPETITIQQLLAHTSGLYDYATDPRYVEAILANPARRWTRAEQIAHAMKHGEPAGRSGERYVYSDTGYVVLGEIIERVTDQPLARAYRELLAFERLGLRATHLETLGPAPARGTARARQYYGTVDSGDWDASFDLYGGGGLVSTTTDVARFFRALLRGELFESRSTLASALMAPQAAQGRGTARSSLLATMPFGRRACWGQDGFWGSRAIYCPDIDLSLVVTLNQAEPTNAHTLDLLVQTLAGILENSEPTMR